MGVAAFSRGALIGAAGGYGSLAAIDKVTEAFSSPKPSGEQAAEEGYVAAARDLSRRLGIPLDEKEAVTVGALFHSGLGVAGGEIYVFLRATTGLSPLLCAPIMAMILFLGVDEALSSAMGWTKKPNEYPLSAHLNGFFWHLGFGFVVAAAIGVLRRLLGANSK